MIKINLLPIRERAKKENIRMQISLGCIITVGFLAGMALFWFLENQRLTELKIEKTDLSQKLASLKKEVGDLAQIKKQKELLEKRKEAIANLNLNRLAIVKVLDEISKAKPDTIYFTDMEQKNTGAPWQDFSLVLEGISTDNETIAQFMRNLERSQVFRVVDLDYTKAKQLRGEGLVFQEFRLNLNIAPGASSAESATPAPKQG